jgi:hypothetical protein
MCSDILALTIPLTIPSGPRRAPFMGIPIPGERPIVLVTEQVRGALANVTITDVSITNDGSIRTLFVSYTHGPNRRGHGRAKFYDRGSNAWLIRQQLRDWAEPQRLARLKPAKPKASKHEIAIRRLEKEKRGIPDHRPRNPLIPPEYDRCDSYSREREARWHEDRPKRRALAKVAGLVLRGRLTYTNGYKRLREMGITFLLYSKIGARDKEQFSQDEYWRQIHRWCYGMLEAVKRLKSYEYEPEEDGTPRDRFTEHAKARREYLEHRREIEAIDLQIASIQELAQPSQSEVSA